MTSSYSFPSLLILLLEYPFEEKVFTFHSFAMGQLSKKTWLARAGDGLRPVPGGE